MSTSHEGDALKVRSFVGTFHKTPEGISCLELRLSELLDRIPSQVDWVPTGQSEGGLGNEDVGVFEFLTRQSYTVSTSLTPSPSARVLHLRRHSALAW